MAITNRAIVHNDVDAAFVSLLLKAFETSAAYAFFGSPGPFRKRIAVSGITLGSTTTLAVHGHRLATGDHVVVSAVSGTKELNGLEVTVTVVDADTVTIPVDSTGFGAYAGGGILTRYSDKPFTTAPMSKSQIMSEIVGLQKIGRPQVSAGLSKRPWTSGTAYSSGEYVTIDDRVYICVKAPSGTPSTETPDDTSYDATATSDGYVWKLVWVPTAEQLEKFGGIDNVIPVSRVYGPESQGLWQAMFTDAGGRVDSITITDRGSGYANENDIVVTVIGDGSGAKAKVTGITGGLIDDIVITDHGSGYSWAVVSIWDASGNGSGAKAEASLSPIAGHGSDVIGDLRPDWLLISARLGRPACHEVFPEGLSFRTSGIIVDPVVRKSVPVTGDCATVLHEIKVSDVTGGFSGGDVLVGEQSGVVATVASQNGSSVFVAAPSGRFSVGEKVKARAGLATVKEHKTSENDGLWGHLVYVSEHAPVTITKEQTVTMAVAINVR